MARTVQMNVQVLPETKDAISQLADTTYRGKGSVVDWIVSEFVKDHPALLPTNAGSEQAKAMKAPVPEPA